MKQLNKFVLYSENLYCVLFDLNNFIDRFFNSWKVARDIFADKHNLSVDTQKIQLCAQISQFYQI